ncbi:hypothetical protein ACETKC_16490 [Brevundimonas intermedia]|uniref:hypothetical protein n=1 Tax=Brevundimonas intermedia TaxID=74315 RepID=UPI0022F2483D|nr:hypothetical protein [Brevundimonas intermedia]
MSALNTSSRGPHPTLDAREAITKPNKNHLYSILFAAFIILSGSLSREAAAAFATFIVILEFSFNKNVYKNGLYATTPIIGIVLLGSASAVFNNFPIYDIFRDAFYWFRLIPMIYCGYILGRHLSAKQLLTSLAFSASMLATFYSINFFLTSNSGELSREALRLKIGRGNAEWFYGFAASIILLLESRRHKNSPLPYLAFASMIAIAAAVSNSRTAFITIIILTLSVTSIIGTRIVAYILAPFCAVAFAILSTPIHSLMFGSFIADHFHQMPRSVSELITLDQKNFVDINEYWRSFESMSAYNTYLAGNVFQYIFGHGFGQQFSIGINFTRLGETYSTLPISHNAIPYVLIKSGLLGLVLYCLFIFINLRAGLLECKRALTPMHRAIGGLIVGIAAFWLISTPTTRGFVDLGATGLTVCGALISCLNRRQQMPSRLPKPVPTFGGPRTRLAEEERA